MRRQAPTGVATGIAALLLAHSAAAQFPLVFATAWMSGPDGDRAFPRAHIGDTVDVEVVVFSFPKGAGSITVNDVSLLVHHGSGDVSMPSLLDQPITLHDWDDQVIVATNFVVQPDDPDILQADCEVHCMYNFDGPINTGVPRGFSAQFGCQIVILKPGPPPLKIAPATGDAVTVSWSISYEGWRLEACSELGGEWLPLAEAPVISNGAFTVTMPNSGRSCQFFRLSKPSKP